MAATKQPSTNPKIKLLAALGACLVIVLVVAVVADRRHTKLAATDASPSPSPTSTQTLGQTTNDAPTSTPTPTVVVTSALAKPTLEKSSGNAPGSSVPSGALVEFTCEGTLGANCVIVLTSQSNAANRIQLDAKPVADNGRGEYFALWDWKAVAGSWNVTAVTSASGQSSTSSDSQTLEVSQ